MENNHHGLIPQITLYTYNTGQRSTILLFFISGKFFFQMLFLEATIKLQYIS